MASQTYERAAEGIAQRGPNSYTARTWRGGPSRTFTGKGAKADAIAWRRDALSKRDRGETVVRKSARTTVLAECEAWLAHEREVAGWTDSSHENYAGRVRNMVAPTIGKLECGSLSKADLEAWGARLVRDGYAPRNVAQTFGMMRRVFTFAVDGKRLATNPALGARAPKRTVEELAAVDALPLEDCAATIDALPPRARIVARLALAAGLRMSEAFALAPEDVDARRRTVRVHRQWRQHKADGRAWYAFDNVKGKHERTVPVPASLIVALQAHAQAFGLSSEGTYAALANGRPYTSQQWACEWERARKATGLDVSGVHQLRHAFGSHLVNAGESIANVSRWMGHANVTTTMRYYLHADADAAPALDLLATGARTNRALRAV